MCQTAAAHVARDSRGLLQHMARVHAGQPLLPEAIAQLRAPGKEACRICAGIRARATPARRRCRARLPLSTMILHITLQNMLPRDHNH